MSAMMGVFHLTKQIYVGIFCNCLDRISVAIYRLLFVYGCLFVLFVRLQISPAKIKIKVAASNLARWFRVVICRESPILETLLPEAGEKRRAEWFSSRSVSTDRIQHIYR